MLLGAQLDQLLEKEPQRRQVRKQGLERIAVHRQDVDSGHGADRRRPWHPPDQSHLPEAFAQDVAAVAAMTVIAITGEERLRRLSGRR